MPHISANIAAFIPIKNVSHVADAEVERGQENEGFIAIHVETILRHLNANGVTRSLPSRLAIPTASARSVVFISGKSPLCKTLKARFVSRLAAGGFARRAGRVVAVVLKPYIFITPFREASLEQQLTTLGMAFRSAPDAIRAGTRTTRFDGRYLRKRSGITSPPFNSLVRRLTNG